MLTTFKAGSACSSREKYPEAEFQFRGTESEYP